MRDRLCVAVFKHAEGRTGVGMDACPGLRRTCCRPRRGLVCQRMCVRGRPYSDIIQCCTLVYLLPLFLLTLYYNYGYDYGATGLHLAWPLLPLVPWLLTGQRGRELFDVSELLSGLSAFLLGVTRRAHYAFLAFVLHGFAYYFSRQRGMQYRRMSSPFIFNLATAATCWFMYVALLQSCVDSRGYIDCDRYKPPDPCERLYGSHTVCT